VEVSDRGLPEQQQWTWIDLSEPAHSPALTAHLAAAVGGRGIPADGFSFADTSDPD
jgi:hypothetical protein